MRRKDVAIAGVFVVLLTAVMLVIVMNTDIFYLRRDAEADLKAARTVADKWAAINRIARNTRVSFARNDGAGGEPSMPTSDWLRKSHAIQCIHLGYQRLISFEVPGGRPGPQLLLGMEWSGLPHLGRQPRVRKGEQRVDALGD